MEVGLAVGLRQPLPLRHQRVLTLGPVLHRQALMSLQGNRVRVFPSPGSICALG